MASFKRISLILLTSCAGASLAACDGANSVASPGAGTVIVNPPAPTPTPTPPTPTPTPAVTAAQFASTAGQNVPASAITLDEQLGLVTGAPGSNNNASGTSPFASNAQPFASVNALPTATDPTSLNTGGITFFQPGTFLGAFSSAADTNWQGWTCNSATLNFGTTGGTAGCNSVPGTAAASTPATSACPAGTTAATIPTAGVINTRRLCTINSPILTNVTLPRIDGIVYRLDGPTEVGVDTGPLGTAPAGVSATLTIEAGVVIAANSSDVANDVLLVNRGSKIDAVGTATQPIIFTAQQNLSNGNTGESSTGLWGGIILLGQSPVGVCRSGTGPNNADGTSTNCENQIEGVTTPRFYGGTDKASNSGRFSFVQIRFTGVSISEGNELQGLTLGGVGSGTQIDHVQSHNSGDDGIEIFGGTSNLRYIALTGAADDGLDVDNGWRGLVQFLVIAQLPAGAASDSFTMEIDSDNNEDFLPRTYGQISNFTFIQTASSAAALRIRGGADFRFVNGILDSNVPCLNVVAQQNRSTYRAADPALQELGPPVFTSNYFACSNR